jgi:hypothetical protein
VSQAETNGKFVWISTSTEKLCFETERVADAKFLCRAIEYLMQASPSTSHISPSHSSGATVDSFIKPTGSSSSTATTAGVTHMGSAAGNSGSSTSHARTAKELADEEMAAAAAAAAAADRYSVYTHILQISSMKQYL